MKDKHIIYGVVLLIVLNASFSLWLDYRSEERRHELALEGCGEG